jgi:hypothetical protein
MRSRGGRYSRSKASPVGELVGQGLSRLQIERKIREHMAILVWAEVVGPQVAGATEVLGVDTGVLRVSTKSSVWANELGFYKSDILRRLNARLGAPPQGEPIIRDILFQNRGLRGARKGPPPTPPLSPTADQLDDVSLSPREIQIVDEGVASLPDDALRERVRRLRLSDAKLRTWRLDSGWLACPRCGELSPPRYDGNAEIIPGEADCSRCRISGWTG